MFAGCFRVLVLVGVLVPAVWVVPALAQPPVPAAVVQVPAPKLSKFAVLAARTGTLLKREQFAIQSVQADGIDASVIRLEDVTGQEVVFALEVSLPDRHGQAFVSEEEMADLKDSAEYIVQNVVKINESAAHVVLEYRALSGASFGYSVHRVAETGEELPPTAYIEVPGNPYYPQLGGMQRLTPQLLQKLVGEARISMDALKAAKKP